MFEGTFPPDGPSVDSAGSYPHTRVGTISTMMATISFVTSDPHICEDGPQGVLVSAPGIELLPPLVGTVRRRAPREVCRSDYPHVRVGMTRTRSAHDLRQGRTPPPWGQFTSVNTS